MSGVYTLIGAIVGALIAFGSAHYVQKRNAALAESDRTHADEQRAEDIERDQERHRRDTQRAAAVLALSHVNVFLDHARELTFALDRDDEQRLGEVWPRYLDAWSSMAASRVHVNVAGPEELRTILPSVRDTLLEYGGRCDAWYYDRPRPRDIDAAEQRDRQEGTEDEHAEPTRSTTPSSELRKSPSAYLPGCLPLRPRMNSQTMSSADATENDDTPFVHPSTIDTPPDPQFEMIEPDRGRLHWTGLNRRTAHRFVEHTFERGGMLRA